MAATIYLRDGSSISVRDATTVTQEFRATIINFVPTLVCRDRGGNILAQFERDTVLGYRRENSPAHLALRLSTRNQHVAGQTLGTAAD